jgi:hypothetical protein
MARAARNRKLMIADALSGVLVGIPTPLWSSYQAPAM